MPIPLFSRISSREVGVLRLASEVRANVRVLEGVREGAAVRIGDCVRDGNDVNVRVEVCEGEIVVARTLGGKRVAELVGVEVKKGVGVAKAILCGGIVSARMEWVLVIK